jgi:arsenate reductase
MSVQIIHNPRCSKSRETLKLLESQGIRPDVRLYLDHPLSRAELEQIVGQLGIRAKDLLRIKEALYQELVAQHGEPDDATALAWMADHPRLVERPIVVAGGKARIGRPPETVLEIL